MDNDINVFYHPSIVNVVEYALSRLSIGSATQVKKERKELAELVYMPAQLRVCFMSISDGCVTIKNSSESS